MKLETLNEISILNEVDGALRADSEQCGTSLEAENEKIHEHGSKLARLLRSVGALVVVAAAVSFLVQRWGVLDHLTRYFSFLAFTSGLGALGVFCGLKLKEDKSARTLLALGGGLVVVNFAQLAAFTYSRFLNVSEFARYPDFLLWQAPSLEALVMALVIGLPLLFLISAASFTALAREIRVPLIACSLVMNLALLIPLRDSASIGFIAFTMVTILGVLHKDIKQAAVTRTFEGRIAQIHLLLPLLILIGRSAYLYETSLLFVGLLSLSASVALFSILPQLFDEKGTKILLQRLSIVTSAVGCFCVSSDLLNIFNAPSEIAISVITIPFIASLIFMSIRCEGNGKFERSLSAIVGVLAIILQLMFFPGIWTFTVALLASILIMSYGFTIKEKTFFICGLLGVGFSLIKHLKFAYEIGAINPWISLAILGTATIIAAAYTEKKFPEILVRFNKAKEHIATWK